MTGKGKVVECSGAIENVAELIEHPNAAERVAPWALGRTTRQTLTRSEHLCAGLAPTTGSPG